MAMIWLRHRWKSILHSLQDTFYGFQEVRFENEDGTADMFS